MSATLEAITTQDEGKKIQKIQTLGSVRQRDEHTNEVILIPTPSQDPNDPLNWSKGRKYYMAVLICLAVFMCTFLAAGPSIAIVSTALEFFPPHGGPPDEHHMHYAIEKTAYFFTTTALLQGVGTLIWMPLVNKYGRRPIYIASFTVYFAVALWLCFEKNYDRYLAARILMGFASGAAEVMAPVSIADVFFLHERGTIMAMYTCALSAGAAGGLIISGLITIKNTWRTIYQVATALIGVLLVLVIFTFPETSYIRSESGSNESISSQDKPGITTATLENQGDDGIPKRKSYLSELKIFNRSFTTESLPTLFFRPIGLVVIPAVLWGSLVMSVTIGFLVAVTSNVAPAYNTAYGFAAWQTGLCFIAAIIGSLIGIFFGGNLSDMIADYFTKRNGGMREPEMRLPAIFISLITTPLALVLFGVGIENKLHWICPTIGLGLLNFSIVQATNVSLVYTIDCYRPIAGEVTVTSMALKSCFGFLLSFYTNPWIAKVGYMNAYGTMAGIAAAVLLLVIPVYIFGKSMRLRTWRWSIVKFVHWSEDREVGE